MIVLKPFYKIVLLVLVILIGGLLILRYQTIIDSLQGKSSTAQIPQNIPIVEQSNASVIQDSEVKTPDGSLKLVMHVDTKNRTKTYTFTVSDINGNNAHPVLTKTITSGDMSLPVNSWSPDNKYVFIQDNENGINGILVLKASGESFANGQQYLDVTSLFSQHITNYSFQEATGWAAPGLLIVETTDNNTGTRGVSYWFEISSQGFIQLASHQ